MYEFLSHVLVASCRWRTKNSACLLARTGSSRNFRVFAESTVRLFFSPSSCLLLCHLTVMNIIMGAGELNNCFTSDDCYTSFKELRFCFLAKSPVYVKHVIRSSMKGLFIEWLGV